MEKYRQLIKSAPAYGLLNKNTQSYLFFGADSLALLLAARFFIEDATGKKSSADIYELPLGEKLQVADIDFLVKTAPTSPLELNAKYFIIKDAESLNDAASNKLLKTLEEPNEKCRIIILARDENSVLPTIRSRCVQIRFGDFNSQALDSIIDAHYSSKPNVSAAKELHLGRITRLEKAIEGEYNKLLDLAADTLLYMKKSGQIAAHSQRLLEQKENLIEIIGLLEIILHDAMLYLLNMPITLKSRRADIANIAAFYSQDVIIRLKGTLEKARQRSSGMGNANSVIDELLFSLLEIRQKYK